MTETVPLFCSQTECRCRFLLWDRILSLFPDPGKQSPLPSSHHQRCSDIQDIFQRSPGETDYRCKETGCPVLPLNVDVFYVHFPDCIRCIHANNGFHYPSDRTTIIACVIQKAVLLHDAEDLIPIDLITGSLKVSGDLLIAIAYNLPAKEISYDGKDF